MAERLMRSDPRLHIVVEDEEDLRNAARILREALLGEDHALSPEAAHHIRRKVMLAGKKLGLKIPRRLSDEYWKQKGWKDTAAMSQDPLNAFAKELVCLLGDAAATFDDKPVSQARTRELLRMTPLGEQAIELMDQREAAERAEHKRSRKTAASAFDAEVDAIGPLAGMERSEIVAALRQAAADDRELPNAVMFSSGSRLEALRARLAAWPRDRDAEPTTERVKALLLMDDFRGLGKAAVELMEGRS